jgi:hypothetical protein
LPQIGILGIPGRLGSKKRKPLKNARKALLKGF